MTNRDPRPADAKTAPRHRSPLILLALVGVLAAVALAGMGCSQQCGARALGHDRCSRAGAAPAARPTPRPPTARRRQPRHPLSPRPSFIKDNKVGKGAVAKSGDTVTVDYTGRLMNGTKFDSSVGRQPFQFQIGAGQVIQGWEQGVPGMKVGGTRTLIIPPSLGYGDAGSPPMIPANATLKFEIKLISIQP